MKYFGTVKSFDLATGDGEIREEVGGGDLRFHQSAILWGNEPAPRTGQRLSYDRGTNEDRQPRAVNLQAI